MPSADISVVIANRNHARRLPRALDAVLSQSAPAREIIILDDDSSDDSVPLLESYSRRYASIRFLRNESHLGVTGSYNRGFALATGTFIVPTAADDYLLPGFFEQAMAEFARFPEAGLCCAYGSCTDGDEGPLIVNDPGWSEAPVHLSPPEVCRRLRHGLPSSAVALRRDELIAAGGLRAELAWYSDWFAYLVVAFRRGAIHIPRTLGVRVHRPGSYETNAAPGAENVRILSDLLRLLLSPEFADVAPFFRRSGVACRFGADWLRAAAARPDAQEPQVLAYLMGLPLEVYAQLALHDANPAVRACASVFLQEPWRDLLERRADLEAENQRLVEEIQLTRLRAAPAGVLGKVQWAARLARRRLRRAMGLHPAGRYR
jgi:glycosyltransferase involved in cell wall biosynthesis